MVKDQHLLGMSPGRPERVLPPRQVSDAVTEARDVLKYLRALEPSWEPLYAGGLAAVQASLPSLLGNVYRMHTVARRAHLGFCWGFMVFKG